MSGRAIAMLALAVVGMGAAGCAKKESLVVVSLTASPPATGDTNVNINAGGVMQSFHVMNGIPGPGSASPVTLGVYVPSSVTGAIQVVVNTTGSGSCYDGATTVDIGSAGATVPATVSLIPSTTCAGASDGGAGGSTGAGGRGAGGATGTGGSGAGGASGAGGSGTDGGGAGGASGAGGGQVVPPSLNNCMELQQFTQTPTPDWGISLPAFSPDGKYLATGDQSGGLKLWTMNGKTAAAEGHTLTNGVNGNMQPAFSPNSTLLAGVTANGGASLWSVGGPNWTKHGDFIGNPAFQNLYGVAFSPDSSQVLILDHDTLTLQVFSASTLAFVASKTFPVKPTSLGVAELASGNVVWTAVGLADGRVAVFNLNTLSAAPMFVQGSAAGVNIDAIALSRDGTLLAAGDSDTKVTLWNVASAGVTARTPAPIISTSVVGGFYGMALSPDARSLVMAIGFPSAVGLWDLASGQNHGTMQNPRYVPVSVAFSPRGDVIVAGESDYGVAAICAD